MEAIKNFFGIERSYKFEWNDLRAILQLLNVILIIVFGLSASWVGLAIAFFGLIKDLTSDRHINGIVMHLSGILLNIHFLIMLYGG